MLAVFGALFAAVALLPSPSARAEPALCPSLELARRGGVESCWASYSLGDARICVPKALWIGLLERGRLPCGRTEGKWKLSAPLLNEPGRDRGDAKPTRRSFHVSSLGSGESSRGARALAWIELRRERLSERLRPRDPLGICRQLLLSEREPGGGADLLRALGFVHVLTATGIHLLAIAGLWDRLLIALRVSRAARWAFIAPSLAAAWLLSGGRAGMLLPGAILALRSFARGRGWLLPRWLPLSVAVGAGLALETGGSARGPLLYGLAVGGGMLGLRLERLGSHLGMALGSWAACAIFELVHEGHLSIATPLLSVLTIPYLSGFAFPALLVSAVPGLEGVAPRVAGVTTELFALLCAASTALPNILVVGAPALGLGALGAALALAAKRRRALAIAALACLILPRSMALSDALGIRLGLAGGPVAASALARSVEQLDVGQGDAALVLGADGRAGLIDTGSERALSEKAWLAILSRRGLVSLDWVALTHLDEDHAGGLFRLARVAQLGCVATSRAELASERGSRFARRLAGLGIRATDWSSSCVPFAVRGPPPEQRGSRESNANMSAIAVPLEGGGFYASLGDARREDELGFASWLERLGFLEGHGPRILKVSHHGSLTSSSPELLARIDPDLAWISSGAGNPFDHPRAAVLGMLERAGVRVERTDARGSLESTDSLRAGAFPRRPRTRPRSPRRRRRSGRT